MLLWATAVKDALGVQILSINKKDANFKVKSEVK